MSGGSAVEPHPQGPTSKISSFRGRMSYLNWQTFEVVFLIFAVLARHGVAVEPRIYRYVACRSTALTCVVHTVRLKILRFRACKMLFRNRNFVQKSKFGSKIEILIQNLNLVQKLKFCSKIEIWFKN